MMKRKYMSAVLALLTAAMLGGCAGTVPAASGTSAQADSAASEAQESSDSEASEADGSEAEATVTEEQAEETAADETEIVGNDNAEAEAGELSTYESADGWKCRYDSSLINVNETDSEVDFVYTGDCAGTCMIAISYIPDQQPEEVLYEKTKDYDDSQITRTEGWFAGMNDWAFTRIINSGDEGSGLHVTYTAAEHNGGALLVEDLWHADTDEERAMKVSDTLAAVMDTFEFTNHEPQTEFSYVPGTYVFETTEEIEGKQQEVTETIVLNADHTGEWTAQDTVSVIWTSYELICGSGEYTYEYTIEGDTLMVELETGWKTFEKTDSGE